MHSYLSLDMNLIPQETKDFIPNFWSGYFSEGNARLMIPGYHANGDLAQDEGTLLSWLQWEANPKATKDLILNDSIEYSLEEFNALKLDVNSIWYLIPEVEL